ncbi:Uncharacterised protein [Mycobacterium tuberculosis]|nr:Uncharacterised protein [Mycobacterium tuberculosis]
MIHALECRGDRTANRQCAVIAQQEVVLLAQVFLDAWTLIVIQRDAFVVVIGEVAGHKLRRLVQRQQTFHATRDSGAVRSMQMHHAAGVFAHFMNGGVNREAQP